MVHGYLIFHLNLAFSSIEKDSRTDVIQRCYWPLLDFAEDLEVPIGIELTGWTLQQINDLDAEWILRFRDLLAGQHCELIGSGWSQIIGPLVPTEVNCWNQRLGLDAYLRLLGIRPQIALVNEMAFSTGMVDVYANAGYKGIIMDRDNVRLALGLDHTPLSATPTHASGCDEVSLPVLWSDSILFQRLQRVVHGDIPASEYLAYVTKRAEEDNTALPIYCSDTEIFDYRPGRYTVESHLHPEGEWKRLRRICLALKDKLALKWVSPGTALEMHLDNQPTRVARLVSITSPIPVKKQAKYNVNRWGLTGRDDLWLNTMCHRLFEALVEARNNSNNSWRELCELWASDLRTHITQARWDETIEKISGGFSTGSVLNRGFRPLSYGDRIDPMSESVKITNDEDGILWYVRTPTVEIVLNGRRGMTIMQLAFKSHEFEPVIGTLPQGSFGSIDLGADFYCGGMLIEIPGERVRLTDLEWVNPTIEQIGKEIVVTCLIPMNHATLTKTIAIGIDCETIRLGYDFGGWERPLGTVRVGILTLIPDAFVSPITLHCTNGGLLSESFLLDRDVNHGHAVSTIVSSISAFGASDGTISISDVRGRGFKIEWDPAKCAALPMLFNKKSGDHFLCRLYFSLSELDDTSKPGGRLLPFKFDVVPT